MKVIIEEVFRCAWCGANAKDEASYDAPQGAPEFRVTIKFDVTRLCQLCRLNDLAKMCQQAIR